MDDRNRWQIGLVQGEAQRLRVEAEQMPLERTQRRIASDRCLARNAAFARTTVNGVPSAAGKGRVSSGAARTPGPTTARAKLPAGRRRSAGLSDLRAAAAALATARGVVELGVRAAEEAEEFIEAAPLRMQLWAEAQRPFAEHARDGAESLQALGQRDLAERQPESGVRLAAWPGFDSCPRRCW